MFAEWLAAHGLNPAADAGRLDAVARFAGLDPARGWAGNLRRRRSERVAIRRGTRSWTFRQLAEDDRAWAEAAGAHADGRYPALVAIVADHLLRADTRPDDTVIWDGDPADPWPFGALAIGAAVVFRPPGADPGGR